MMAGAEKAAAETGAVLDMKGATSETAYDEQQNMIETDLHANKYDAMIIAPLQGDMASTLVSGTDMPIFAIDTDFNAPEKISFIGIGQKDAAASGGEKAVEAAKAAGWDKIEAAYIAGVQVTPPPMHAAPVSRKALTAQAARSSRTRCSMQTP